jgi:hypothetical protein
MLEEQPLNASDVGAARRPELAEASVGQARVRDASVSAARRALDPAGVDQAVDQTRYP